MMKQVKITVPRRVVTLACGLTLAVTAFGQQVAVKGHVVDAAGEPVIGATVRVAGQEGGTVTDIDGNFVLNANSGATISVDYIGYESYKGTVSPTMSITLHEGAEKSLNEVVVIGYGAVKKSDLTGSVTALKPDSKNKGLVVNAQDMLIGKVAGVNVSTNDGTPGGGATIRVRGGSSLTASNDPLIVIDGLAMDNEGVKGLSNILSSINPQDIESFNVLKDASATAIYGSRGSNGVIIITTKKGRKGLQVSYAGSATVSMKKKTIDVMDADQYRGFIKNLFGEDSVPYSYLGTANTDWQDEIYRTAISHDHNVTVSGAMENLPYRVSVGYTDQQGILKTSDFKRFTGSLNLSPSLFNDHLKINLNAKGLYAKTKYAETGAIGAAVYMDPTQSPYGYTSVYHKGLAGIDQTLKNFGGYFEWPTAGGSLEDSQWPYTIKNEATKNPLAMLYGRNEHANSKEFIGSADFDYQVHGFEDLRLHATLGADIAQGTQYTENQPWYPASVYYGSWGDESILKRNLQLSTYAQYFHDFNDKAKNHFDIMAGYEWQHFWRDKDNDYVGYYPQTNNSESLRGTARPHTPYHYITDHYLVSFFGRANWSLMDRYYVTFTLRQDGSSRFKEHWATFPSAAFAWKVKDENKFRDISWLSDLKLRLGWGMTGQQEGQDIDDYGWIPTYSKNTGTGSFYPVDGDGHLYRPDNFNEDLKWETTTTYNIGLDWGLFGYKLSGSVDWYYRKTTDLLNQAPAAALSAYKNETIQNIGSLYNTGVEAAITWHPITTKDWNWTLTYNFTYNKNRITDLSGVSDNGLPVPTGDNVSTGNKAQANQVGYPARSFYVYQQVYDQNGNPIENVVVDRNADGVINESDKYLYKNPAAPLLMGLSSRLEYKNWDLGFNLRASIGNYVYNNVEAGASNLSQSAIWAQSAYIANRPTMALARNWQTDELQSRLSDFYVHNASFLKMDNITLGYSFSNLFRGDSWKGMSGRIYGSVSNVFTITNYNGLDPEVNSGIDNSQYPRPISFIMGLNLSF